MIRKIYLAGGCFWGLEYLFCKLTGVKEVYSGYANGIESITPDYRTVCKGKTKYKETIEVNYDDTQTSLEALLFAYFSVIDPTIANRQGFDKGTQYQVGIYFEPDDYITEAIVSKIVAIEKKAVKSFVVEVEPLRVFHKAEEYHQRYLIKNPGGYCHINPARIKEIAKFSIEPKDYVKPAKEILHIEI